MPQTVTTTTEPRYGHLTAKQEAFCLNIFESMSQREAYVKAGYSGNALPSTLDRMAFDLYWSPKISARREELRQKAEDDSVASVLECEQILTEIVRAQVTDFVENNRIKVKAGSLNSHAVSEVTTEDIMGRMAVVTKLKLHDKVRAIDLIFKKRGLYQDGAQVNNNININNNMEANIVHFDAGEVAKAILEAARLGLASGLLGGNGHGESAALLSASTDVQAAPIPQPEN